MQRECRDAYTAQSIDYQLGAGKKCKMQAEVRFSILRGGGSNHVNGNVFIIAKQTRLYSALYSLI